MDEGIMGEFEILIRNQWTVRQSLIQFLGHDWAYLLILPREGEQALTKCKRILTQTITIKYDSGGGEGKKEHLEGTARDESFGY